MDIMEINPVQKKALRAKAHKLKPVVTVGGRGLGKSVLAEIDQSLSHHELMKIRLNAEDRTQKKALIDTICRETGSQMIQAVGHVLTLYRPNNDKDQDSSR